MILTDLSNTIKTLWEKILFNVNDFKRPFRVWSYRVGIYQVP